VKKEKNPAMKTTNPSTGNCVTNSALQPIRFHYFGKPKLSRGGSLLTVLLAAHICIALAAAPKVFGVVPPPDGYYPAFTTAEGQNALFSLTTGFANTAVGWSSLRSNATGDFNTATGAGALLFNNGDSTAGEASKNTAFGAAALLFNTIGSSNTANGAGALEENIIGSRNTADGDSALHNNTVGEDNTASGVQALLNNLDGSGNVAMGASALLNNTSGFQNTALGLQALSNNSTGHQNTAIGINAGHDVTTAANVTCIGDSVFGENVSNSCYIGHIFGQPSSGGTAVFVNLAGKLGTTTSSRRFKEEIKPMDKASEAILALRPVSFRYKKDIDPQGTPQFGLVAEEVEKVNPDLVVRDKEGKVNTVRYDQVNAMLLNEFLKEHRKLKKLEATMAQQQEGMEAVIMRFKEQDSKIQKVSDQVKLSEAARQIVRNNH
jgi:hypothetical protein